MPKSKVSDLITEQEMAFARLVPSGTMNDRDAAQTVGRAIPPILRRARRQTRQRILALSPALLLTPANLSPPPTPLAP